MQGIIRETVAVRGILVVVGGVLVRIKKIRSI